MKPLLLPIAMVCLLTACSSDWEDIAGFQGRLRCGMGLDQVEDLAVSHDLQIRESRLGDHFTHTVSAANGLDQLALTLQSDGLQTVQAYRHTGPKQLCEYPEVLLCAGGSRVRLTVQHSAKLQGSTLVVDGEEQGVLFGGAVDLYLPPGRHSIEAISAHGSRLVREVRIELPEECHDQNPRLELDPSGRGGAESRGS